MPTRVKRCLTAVAAGAIRRGSGARKLLQPLGSIILLLTATFAASGGEVWLKIGMMNRPDATDSVRVYASRAGAQVDPIELSKRLGVKWELEKGSGRLTLHLPMRSLIFSAGTPFVLAGDEVRQMPLPLTPPGSRILAPLEPLVALLAEFYSSELLYDPAEPRLLVAQSRCELFGLRYLEGSAETRVIIPSGKLFECRLDTLTGGVVSLFFPGGTLDTANLEFSSAQGLVADVEARQTAEGAQILLTPETGAWFDGLMMESDPPLYAVTFRTAISTQGPDEDDLKRLEEDRKRWALDVVVIDPGHGGRDPGAVGKKKLKEKEVTLDVGLRLRKALEKRGIKTVMTRDNDTFIELHRRTQIANSSGGKLFISLHCNASKDRKATGSETYFLAPAKNDRAMTVAMRENEVVRFEESRDQYRDLTEENYILLAMAQANFAIESQDLAAMVQSGASEGLASKDRGVDQAGFYVLVGASMPAVLFETEFISNLEIEKKLRDKSYRQKVADEICESVVEFLKTMKTKGSG